MPDCSKYELQDQVTAVIHVFYFLGRKAALACLGGAQKLGSFFDALGEHTVKGVTAIQPRSTPGIPVNCIPNT